MLHETTDKACPVCGNPHVTYWRTYKSILLNKCRRCHTVFKDDLTPEHYQEGLEQGYYDERLHDQKDLCHKKAVLDWLKTYVKCGKLLDIGCSIGHLLQFARDDFDVYGIDSSLKAIEYCKSIIPEGSFHCGLFEQVDLEENCFDLITVIEVIEHIVQPNSFVRKIFGKLKTGGILFIATGNIKSLQAILKRKSWHYFTKDHIVYYDIKTLSYLLEKNNFEILEKNAPVRFKYLLRTYSCFERKMPFLKSCGAKFYFCGYTYDGMSIVARKT